ncbi:Fe-S cluster assembly protein SufD [Alloscardovia theropitheci]|uniref:Fe-S cluster assembly protein SufD n=1 Tax=Alloscardovia theropitheci TaxID=2496842 RepID=A0A4V2MU60_9BIFI|nr:Fe-S cluster assembly protein SufD [Alloscardovia theropitheci]TCD55069.1 Fe-S cluster assembly protein SufD [Alloscardovia theropitheci]
MVARKEISIPVADPNNPYAIPAAMPSSADRNPRSFDVNDFAIPAKNQEDWRFTPIDRITEFTEIFNPAQQIRVELSMIDGSDVPESVTLRAVDKGQAPVGTVSLPNDRVSAVEWQSFKTAMHVHIAQDCKTPILIKVSSSSFDLDALHLVITTDALVHAHVVVEHEGDARLAEGVEISTGDFSQVSTTFIHEWSDTSKHVGNHRIHVGKGASLRHNVVTLGGQVVRIRMDQDFGGEQGEVNMLGIYFAEPGEHIEHRTMVVHNHPECKSRVIYKGALSGQGAHSTWVGNALIEPTAPGTDSYELNRNLILVPGAIADSEPNLEIENGNIVGAGHASSVGRFDDEELFYLMSRGIPEKEAQKLVVAGFFNELIEQIDIPAISEHLMNTVNARLER